jgi:hypothetical protein
MTSTESQSTDAPNPLDEASPESIDELFDRDPLELSDQDVDKIVARLRQDREAWAADEASAQTSGKCTKRQPNRIPQSQLKIETLGLDNLDLDLDL